MRVKKNECDLSVEKGRGETLQNSPGKLTDTELTAFDIEKLFKTLCNPFGFMLVIQTEHPVKP